MNKLFFFKISHKRESNITTIIPIKNNKKIIYCLRFFDYLLRKNIFFQTF